MPQNKYSPSVALKWGFTVYTISTNLRTLGFRRSLWNEIKKEFMSETKCNKFNPPQSTCDEGSNDMQHHVV